LQERTTWVYDVLGRIVTLTHANGSRAGYSYSAAGWVTNLVNATARSEGREARSERRHGRRRLSLLTPLPSLPGLNAVGNRLTKLTGGVTTIPQGGTSGQRWPYDAANELTLEDAAGTQGRRRP
jgi:YD repeat-containing protein